MPGSNLSTTLVGAGNAAGLFPVITPTPTPSPGPAGTNPAAENTVSPAGRAVDVVTDAPATPVLALIGLAVAFLLVMTRLSGRGRRKRPARVVPQITPTPAPIPSPAPAGTDPAAEHNVSPAGRAEDISAGAPATPVLGLIALGVAFLLVTTRLFARRRRARRGPGA
jgi:hypothetical protein